MLVSMGMTQVKYTVKGVLEGRVDVSLLFHWGFRDPDHFWNMDRKSKHPRNIHATSTQ
jgi:hypothetical protein